MSWTALRRDSQCNIYKMNFWTLSFVYYLFLNLMLFMIFLCCWLSDRIVNYIFTFCYKNLLLDFLIHNIDGSKWICSPADNFETIFGQLRISFKSKESFEAKKVYDSSPSCIHILICSRNTRCYMNEYPIFRHFYWQKLFLDKK